MNEKLKFYKGNESALPDIIPEPGSLYHCEDTGNTYLANENGELEIYSNTFTFSAAEADATVLANADLLGGYPASDYAFIEDLKNLKPEDIGAAPAGYGGYGEVTEKILCSTNAALFAAFDNKLAKLPYGSGIRLTITSSEQPLKDYHYSGVLQNYESGIAVFRGITYGAKMNDMREPIEVVICKTNENWFIEFINPPMELGVEYRTTKRHNGQAVYTKLLSYNPKSFTEQTVLLPHEISNFRVGLSINVMWNKGGMQWRHFPSIYYGDTAWNGHAYWHGTESICFECGSTLRQLIESSGWNVRVLLEYTKEMQ